MPDTTERPNWIRLASAEERKLKTLLKRHPELVGWDRVQVQEVCCTHKYHRSGLTKEECEAKARYYEIKEAITEAKGEINRQRRWEKDLRQWERDLKLFGPGARLQWMAMMDERTCPTCRARDGHSYTVNEVRRLGRHVGCRCTCVIDSGP